MWIFSSSSSDPMLLDSCAGLRELHARIETFLKSTDQTLALSAATDGNPAPYERFLLGLRITKSEGTARLSRGSHNWLQSLASAPDLQHFNKKVLVEHETEHHHWYCSPISLIIEADSARVASHESQPRVRERTRREAAHV